MAKETVKKDKKSVINRKNKPAIIIYIICQAISVLTLLLALASFIAGRSELNKFLTHAGLCFTAITLLNIPTILRRKFKLYIPPFLQITVTLFIVMHFVVGEIFRAYDHSLYFDKILHTTSGLTIAICGFSLVNLLNESSNAHLKLSPFFVALFSFCFALAIGYLWEIFEFAVDSIIGTNMQRWQDSFTPAVINGEEIMKYGQGSGLIDTMGDLIVNAIGAAIISFIGWILLKAKNPKIQGLLICSIKNEEKYKSNLEEAKQILRSKRKKEVNQDNDKEL